MRHRSGQTAGRGGGPIAPKEEEVILIANNKGSGRARRDCGGMYASHLQRGAGGCSQTGGAISPGSRPKWALERNHYCRGGRGTRGQQSIAVRQLVTWSGTGPNEHPDNSSPMKQRMIPECNSGSPYPGGRRQLRYAAPRGKKDGARET
ncbi:hypothetical protein CHS0354_040645 [Potamilus streckersoni]|uniref:Uncharacterized protein n=1 Tax=Potamilus streckersoni TaxID=2493646 RepID=A0AAE0TD67_9BIVA|nr:hypothetical protein CHS0354_040645 [Potamilus streckersoni]